jgi:hypothetical protein
VTFRWLLRGDRDDVATLVTVCICVTGVVGAAVFIVAEVVTWWRTARRQVARRHVAAVLLPGPALPIAITVDNGTDSSFGAGAGAAAGTAEAAAPRPGPARWSRLTSRSPSGAVQHAEHCADSMCPKEPGPRPLIQPNDGQCDNSV